MPWRQISGSTDGSTFVDFDVWIKQAGAWRQLSVPVAGDEIRPIRVKIAGVWESINLRTLSLANAWIKSA